MSKKISAKGLAKLFNSIRMDPSSRMSDSFRHMGREIGLETIIKPESDHLLVKAVLKNVSEGPLVKDLALDFLYVSYSIVGDQLPALTTLFEDYFGNKVFIVNNLSLVRYISFEEHPPDKDNRRIICVSALVPEVRFSPKSRRRAYSTNELVEAYARSFLSYERSLGLW